MLKCLTELLFPHALQASMDPSNLPLNQGTTSVVHGSDLDGPGTTPHSGQLPKLITDAQAELPEEEQHFGLWDKLRMTIMKAEFRLYTDTDQDPLITGATLMDLCARTIRALNDMSDVLQVRPLVANLWIYGVRNKLLQPTIQSVVGWLEEAFIEVRCSERAYMHVV